MNPERTPNLLKAHNLDAVADKQLAQEAIAEVAVKLNEAIVEPDETLTAQDESFESSTRIAISTSIRKLGYATTDVLLFSRYNIGAFKPHETVSHPEYPGIVFHSKFLSIDLRDKSSPRQDDDGGFAPTDAHLLLLNISENENPVRPRDIELGENTNFGAIIHGSEIKPLKYVYTEATSTPTQQLVRKDPSSETGETVDAEVRDLRQAAGKNLVPIGESDPAYSEMMDELKLFVKQRSSVEEEARQ